LEEYLVPASAQCFEQEIKRSRFLTSVLPVTGRDEAKDELAAVRAAWPDANHHCWAMVAGPPNDIFQQDQSDDGEPRGTAGKPMLNVLTHSGLGNTLVVVTRYFGGIKLGAGGLVRAYSSSVSHALVSTETKPVLVRKTITVVLNYSDLATLEYKFKELNTTVEERNFSDNVRLRIAYPASNEAKLLSLLAAFEASCVRED